MNKNTEILTDKRGMAEWPGGMSDQGLEAQIGCLEVEFLKKVRNVVCFLALATLMLGCGVLLRSIDPAIGVLCDAFTLMFTAFLFLSTAWAAWYAMRWRKAVRELRKRTGRSKICVNDLLRHLADVSRWI